MQKVNSKWVIVKFEQWVRPSGYGAAGVAGSGGIFSAANVTGILMEHYRQLYVISHDYMLLLVT